MNIKQMTEKGSSKLAWCHFEQFSFIHLALVVSSFLKLFLFVQILPLHPRTAELNLVFLQHRVITYKSNMYSVTSTERTMGLLVLFSGEVRVAQEKKNMCNSGEVQVQHS